MPGEQKSLWKRLATRLRLYEERETPGYKLTRLGFFRYFDLRSPAIVRSVFTDGKNFKGPEFQKKMAAEIIGNSLINSEGESWARQRRLFADYFSAHSLLNNVAPIADAEAKSAIARWTKGGAPAEIDVEHEMRLMSGHIIMHALFGGSIAPKDADDIIDVIESATIQSFRGLSPAGLVIRALGLHRLRESFGGMGGDMPAYYKSPAYEEAKKKIDSIIYPVIAERRKLAAQPPDILGRMIAPPPDRQTGQPVAAPMTDKEIRDNILMFIVAGHDTTSVGLTYAILEILKDPAALRQARREMDAAAGGGPLEARHFYDVPQLQRAFKDAVRMHPPSHSVGREAATPVKIADIQFRKGDVIRLNLPAALHDAASWPEPGEFRPERMPPDFKVPQDFVAFGKGPRTCIGMPLSMVEATSILGNIFNSLNGTIVREPEGEDHSSFSTIIQGKLICRMTPRDRSHEPDDGTPPAPPPTSPRDESGGKCPFHRLLGK